MIRVRMIAVVTGVAAAAVMGAGVSLAATGTPAGGYPGFGDSCANGIYSEYCGAQVNAYDQAITAGYNGELTARRYFAGDASQQFVWLGWQGGSSDIAEYAPDGVASGKIMAEQGSRIVLVTAPQQVTNSDLWYFSSGDWVNVASGKDIGVGPRGQLILVTGPTSNDWTFEVP